MHLEELMRQFENETGLSICLYIHQPMLEQLSAFHLNPDQSLHHAPPCLEHKQIPADFLQCRLFKQKTVADALRLRAPFRRTCPFHVKQHCFPFFLNDELAGILYACGESARSGPALRFLMKFIELELQLQSGTAPGGRKRRDMNYYFGQIEDYIAKYYSRNIGLAEIAEKLQVNPSHLGRIIRIRTGKTFRELLTDRRLAESEIYLKLHRMQSITEIAHLCGYEDSNYFSSVFSRRYGMSPRQYRQMHPASENTAKTPPDTQKKAPSPEQGGRVKKTP